MKKFIYQNQSHFTADSDHFKANNRTLADFSKPYKLSPKNNRLLLADLGGMLFTQSEKEIAEPGNSFNLSKANSTPNRAFFVRNFRTPKENNQLKIQQVAFLSMVERNGKGSPFAVFLLKRFSSPLRSTAQILESLSGRLSKNLLSKDTMNKPTQTINGIIAKLTAFPFVLSTEKGACYA
ncbi:phage P4 Ash-like protein [Bibersteinia trehalosi USDA-ARS-USMARC-190]|uniref:Phage P4 Ash-like protein n=1 Tax=Bibersteinia trehalosi USDA-ARS-USMARC-190 TaxID=1263832 RepID=W0R939_BIBTR|nr:ash family protein [Bibersteinia trehalosi]AHG87296.1 phage P4 Ash-like protein [Bibersteinia trehalosi USDA-ARS-USMARC-190]